MKAQLNGEQKKLKDKGLIISYFNGIICIYYHESFFRTTTAYKIAHKDILQQHKLVIGYSEYCIAFILHYQKISVSELKTEKLKLTKKIKTLTALTIRKS